MIKHVPCSDGIDITIAVEICELTSGYITFQQEHRLFIQVKNFRD